MKQFLHFQNRSIKYSWIGTYTCLIMLPIIISIVMFFIVDGSIKNQINKSNQFALRQAQQYMNSLIKDIQEQAIDIAFTNDVQKAAQMSGDLTVGDREILLRIYKNMQRNYYNSAIESEYIYFQNIDTVISNENILDSVTSFNLFSDDNKIDFNDWTNVNKKRHYGNYVNLNSIKDSKRDSMAYILSLPSNGNSKLINNVAVIVDKSKLLSMVYDIESLNKGSMGIIDKNNQLILNSGNIDIFKNINYNNLQGNSGIQFYNLEGKSMTISYLNSPISNLKFIYIMPTSTYWSFLSNYRKLIYIGLISCIILAVITSYLLLNKNYKPIKQLLKNSNYIADKNDTNVFNEYNFIQNTFLKYIDAKKELDRWVTIQNEHLCLQYIENLLKGYSINLPRNNQNMTTINFTWDYFSVVTFQIDYSNLLLENSSENIYLVNPINNIQYVIQKTIGDLMKSIGTVYPVYIDGMMECLVNINSDSDEMKKSHKDVGSYIQKIVNEQYNVKFNIFISNIYKGCDKIQNAYKETQELLELKDTIDIKGVMLYSDICCSLNRNYYFPLQIEQDMIYSFKSGNFEKTCIILEEVFNHNFNELNLSNGMISCLKLNIIGALINGLNDIASCYGDEYYGELILIEHLLQVKNINKMKEELLQIVKNICDKINQDKKSGNPIVDKILNFIKGNYEDENLNISALSNKFNLSPSYMSKLYKLRHGEGLNDYLNKVRVEEAKKLIETRKYNLEAIAKKVGYSNIKTFNRAFIKLENISPGKYKVDIL